MSQEDSFAQEITALKSQHSILHTSFLLPLKPFLDSSEILQVGGREQHSNLHHSQQHPVILHGKNFVSRMMVHTEQQHLLHAGPTLLISSLCRRFHIIGCRKLVRSITQGCVTCCHISTKPKPQLQGQLPLERVTPDSVFEKVGVDYVGPVYVKHGLVCKPVIVKAYVCIFVSLTVKAVHIELVSDLTTEAFLASLRHFIARRGKPTLI